MSALAGKTVQALTEEIAGASQILQQFGLEHYSEEPLAEACAIAGVPVEEILRKLANVSASKQSEPFLIDQEEPEYGDCSTCNAQCPSARGYFGE